ncbi:MAG: DinB family protein [Acidobacteria bacterium]|nr:DinB family protein [Acidobacteriota bacterium]
MGATIRAMDEGLRVVSELNQRVLKALKDSLDDLGDDEIDWRPLPESNSINVIVRHLRIEAQWHLDSLRQGDAMLSAVTPDLQKDIDAVPLYCRRNLEQLEEIYAAFLDVLRATTLAGLQQRTAAAYGDEAWSPVSAHFLGYHQALHVAMHCGQIRTIRNLYRKTRGERARFFPENPTYPA